MRLFQYQEDQRRRAHEAAAHGDPSAASAD